MPFSHFKRHRGLLVFVEENDGLVEIQTEFLFRLFNFFFIKEILCFDAKIEETLLYSTRRRIELLQIDFLNFSSCTLLTPPSKGCILCA
jgi:hypothetical protein